MKKEMILKAPGVIESQSTDYDYFLGEMIRVNSTDVYRCEDIIVGNDKISYIFKKGLVVHNFDWC